MPLPMVHLSVAKEFTMYNKQFQDSPEFYLGVISPDAIHMRENSNREDKKNTHFIKDNKINIRLLLEFLTINKENSNYNFLLGYGIHILTDEVYQFCKDIGSQICKLFKTEGLL